jgi:acyl carrier protein
MEHALTSVADVVHQLKQILVQDLLLEVTLDQIPDDYSLLEDGLALDSIVIEEFIVLIEDRFNVRFDDRVLSPKILSNLSMLAEFVARQQEAAASSREPGSMQTSSAGG